MKRLIHNNMTVSEQFALMKKFDETVDAAWTKHSSKQDRYNVELKKEFVEERFGIRCKVLVTDSVIHQGRLVEPRIVDEKKCLFYLIQSV